MKVFLLWTAVIWVVSISADRPCAEYCIFLLSGNRGIDFQPECNCINEEAEFESRLDDTSIYYEPVKYMSLLGYIQKQPFYILNPIIQGRETYYTRNNPIQPSLNSRTYNIEIDLNVENPHTTHNRQEKDIQSNNQRLTAPIYLDLDVESEDVKRSASTNTFAAEELKLTEQNLLECTNLYAVLHSKENTGTKDKEITTPNQSNTYNHFSNAKLKTLIQNKCSRILYIVEQSLKEIKKTRSKTTSVNFRTNGDDQQNNVESRLDDSHNINKHTYCTNTTENSLESSVQRENSATRTKEYNENQEQIIIIHKESHENTSDNLNTLTSQVSSTFADLTSAADIQSFLAFNTATDDISMEISSDVTEPQATMPIDLENIHSQQRETSTLLPTISNLELLSSTTVILTNTDTEQQKNLENQHTKQEYKTANVEGHYENRTQYEEGEVPLVKIITHEFSNNTVLSFINGTEDVPNGDFNDELKSPEIDNENIVPKKNVLVYKYTGSTPQLETSTPKKADHGTAPPDISGKLYFVFHNHQVPTKFVQNVNGSLHLSIDGVSLCNKLTQNHEHSSTLLTNLCNCYKTSNCTQKGSD